MKRVIISGANGFVGSALVRELLNHDYEVYALDRGGCSGNLPQNEQVHFVACDLSEMGTLTEKLPRQDYDAFFHFAWVGSAGPARAAPGRRGTGKGAQIWPEFLCSGQDAGTGGLLDTFHLALGEHSFCPS